MNISEALVSLPDLIGKAVEANQWFGYLAIMLAMFLENLFPPIPSELIIPLGGFYVAQGQLSFFPVIFAGLIGTLLGAFPWYGICLLYTSPSPRDATLSRMPSSA